MHENIQSPDYTNLYRWNFNNLEPGEQRFVYIPAICLLDVFDKVNVFGSISFGCNRESVDYELISYVSNFPHDPNCILARPEALYTIDIDQPIEYRIYFQNEGIDPAVNVIIELEIDAPKNLINLNAASHECHMKWDGNNLAKFTFEEIFLPGTGQEIPPADYNETIGWVDIEVCYPLSEFTLEDIRCAIAEAQIIFDLQPPVEAEKQICRE